MSGSDEAMGRRGNRSYVIREGRMTPGQLKAFESSWPVYGVEPDSVKTAFSDDKPIVLEIGFGMGDSLFEQARDNAHENYIGVEMHRPGIGHLMQLARLEALHNLKIVRADAALLLANLPMDWLTRVQIFFPDPWHKKRHHKRRLVSTDFITELGSKLKPGGCIHLATDWENYAEVMTEVFSTLPQFAPAPPLSRPETKYERRGKRLGHPVADLVYRRIC